MPGRPATAVKAVNKAAATPMNVKVRRGPKRSASHRTGILNVCDGDYLAG